MFEGFKHVQLQTSDPEVTINLRYGGKGPGLLLLHGSPLTHVTWHKIAPRLAQNFTVVASDLRGYGDSSKPRGQPDHSNYTFRRMAQDQVEVMEQLGFREFFLSGHDRGARAVFRLALHHSDRVRKFASIEIVPSHCVWTEFPRGWALHSYHWMFMAQPYDFPERLLSSNLEYYMQKKLEKHMHGQGDSSPRQWPNTCGGARPSRSMACVRTTVRRPRWISPWTRRTSRWATRLPAPCWCYGRDKSHVEQYFNPREA
jgi:haloacetate dehalogenase